MQDAEITLPVIVHQVISAAGFGTRRTVEEIRPLLQAAAEILSPAGIALSLQGVCSTAVEAELWQSMLTHLKHSAGAPPQRALQQVPTYGRKALNLFLVGQFGRMNATAFPWIRSLLLVDEPTVSAPRALARAFALVCGQSEAKEPGRLMTNGTNGTLLVEPEIQSLRATARRLSDEFRRLPARHDSGSRPETLKADPSSEVPNLPTSHVSGLTGDALPQDGGARLRTGSEVTETDRAVARAAATAFGGTRRVARFYDTEEVHHIDILTCKNRPVQHFSSFSTVGLHRFSNQLDGTQVPVELAGVASEACEAFPNVLATAAFCVIKDHWLCAPGVVFPSLISDYNISPTMRHVLWVPPFPWPELGDVELTDELSAHWLLAVPISESERKVVYDRGFDEFESMLADREVEYYDLGRASIV